MSSCVPSKVEENSLATPAHDVFLRASALLETEASCFRSAVQSTVPDQECGPWSDWTPCSIPCGAQGSRERKMTCTDEKGEAITTFKFGKCMIPCRKPIRTYPKPTVLVPAFPVPKSAQHTATSSHCLLRSLHLPFPLPRCTPTPSVCVPICLSLIYVIKTRPPRTHVFIAQYIPHTESTRD